TRSSKARGDGNAGTACGMQPRRRPLLQEGQARRGADGVSQLLAGAPREIAAGVPQGYSGRQSVVGVGAGSGWCHFALSTWIPIANGFLRLFDFDGRTNALVSQDET